MDFTTAQASLSHARAKNTVELRKIAEYYPLDSDAIDARARNPRVERRSVAGRIRSFGSNSH